MQPTSAFLLALIPRPSALPLRRLRGRSAVAGTAVSVGAGAVGLAADAAIGTARISGKAVGAAADAVLPDSDSE